LNNQVKDEARRMLLLYLAHAPGDRQAVEMLREVDGSQ
jgi:hypothetical protein